MQKAYASHIPTPDTVIAVVHVRKAFSAMHEELVRTLPKTREASVALTNLELACMWAVKALVHGDPRSTQLDEFGQPASA